MLKQAKADFLWTKKIFSSIFSLNKKERPALQVVLFLCNNIYLQISC
jgi:hypothetical protein